MKRLSEPSGQSSSVEFWFWARTSEASGSPTCRNDCDSGGRVRLQGWGEVGERIKEIPKTRIRLE